MIYGTCLKKDTNLWNIFQFSEEAFQFAAKLRQSCAANSTLKKHWRLIPEIEKQK